MEIKDWLDTSIKLIGLIGIYIAAINYRSQRIIKKGEWLKSLFEKFFEDDRYKDVRLWVDFEILDKELSDDLNHAKEEKLSDFLNFFEFIANLEAENQISHKDVLNLFQYYLQRIKQSPLCMQWIKQYGFKKLENLLIK